MLSIMTVAMATLVLSLPSDAVRSGGRLAVIVNPDVAAENLTFAELRKILIGDQQFWSQGKRVTILVRSATSPERTALLETVYQMNEAQFKQYWIAKVFRAEATSGPKVVTSTAMAGELARGIPGAIAVVSAAEVPKGVKVLTIDGKKPDESGYKLTF